MQHTSSESGFTLVEALVATVIIGIGFAGTYTLTGIVKNSMQKAVIKQEMQLQANQILDLIETDLSNVDLYHNINLSNCTAPLPEDTEKYQLRPYDWCLRLNDKVGPATVNDTRSLEVTTLADGCKVVHIVLEGSDGTIQIVMKRAYEL